MLEILIIGVMVPNRNRDDRENLSGNFKSSNGNYESVNLNYEMHLKLKQTPLFQSLIYKK